MGDEARRAPRRSHQRLQGARPHGRSDAPHPAVTVHLRCLRKPGRGIWGPGGLNAPGPPTRGPRETRGFRGVGNTGARALAMRTRGAEKTRVQAGRIRGPHAACFVGWIGARGPLGLFGRTSRLAPFEYRRALLEERTGGLSRVARSAGRDVTLRLAVEHSGETQVECVIEVRLDGSQCEWCESRDPL